MIGIGVMGAGRVINPRYVEVFRDELEGARVVRVCDPVEEKARTTAGHLDAAHSVDDAEVLEDPAVDVVLIATESGHHYDHAVRALRAGKHVIVEKPPAMRPDEVRSMHAIAEEEGRMLALILQNRFNPAMRALKAAVDEGRFGRIVAGTVRLRWCRYQGYYEDGWHGTWGMDGGVINQQAFHHVDGLQWLCGPVEKVVAAQANALNELEAEDTTFASLRFHSGALGAIEATTAVRPEDTEASISVIGEGGMVVVGGIALNRIQEWTFVEPREGDDRVPELHSQDVPTGYGLSHGPLMQEIVDRIAGGEFTPPISALDGLPAVELVHAMYASAETGAWATVGKAISSRLGVREPAQS